MNSSITTLVLFITTICAPSLTKAESPTTTPRASLSQQLDQLCSTLEEQRQKHHIPGMAIAIVKDDKVVLSRGFGLRDIENNKPVNENTLFAIGSSTKAFTATLIGMLVDEGKMQWDDKISRHIPYFKLKDQTANDKVTIRDMLCHRSGLARMGILWAGNKVDRETIIRHTAKVKPAYDFREKFNYTNIGFLIAGAASAKACKADNWDTLLKQRIFDPLHMSKSHTDAAKFRSDTNASKGYYWEEFRNDYVNPPLRTISAVAPAGAINSNVTDMAQWLRFQLGGGIFEGNRLISKASLTDTRTPQIHIAGNLSYGMGWMLKDWNGHATVFHGGNIDGFGAMVGLMPDENIGFVLLTNVTATPLQDSARELVWHAMLNSTSEDKLANKSKPGKPISLDDLQKYLGRYRLERLKVDTTVQIKNDKLAFEIPGQGIVPLHWPDESDRWTFEPNADIQVAFDKPIDGIIPSMTLYQTVRIPLLKSDNNTTTANMSSLPNPGAKWRPEQLEPLIGTYLFSSKNITFNVANKKGRLRVEIPNAKMKTLKWPDKNGQWDVKGKPGQSMRFNFDDFGKVKSAEFSRKITMKMPRLIAESNLDTTIEDLLSLRGHDRTTWPANLKMRSTGTANLVNQGVQGKITEIIDGPNRYILQIDLSPYGYIKTVVDGDIGWVDSDIDVSRIVVGKELELLKLANPWRNFGDWRASFKSVEIIKKDKLDGEKVYVVKCTLKYAPTITRYVSAKTGLVLQDDSFLITNGKPALPIKLHYTNYRKINGIQLPTRTVRDMRAFSNGEMNFNFDHFETDFDIPNDTFKRPDNLK